MIAVALCLLGLLDASFSGYRAFAGRVGRIDKRQEMIAAAKAGLAAGVVGLMLLAVILLGTIGGGLVDYAALETAGRRMLMVYLPYLLAITLGFAAYFSPWLELRSLGTIAVLGPGTLVRPLVILAGALAAGWGRSAVVMICALAAATVILSLELVLNRFFAARYRGHPFASS